MGVENLRDVIHKKEAVVAKEDGHFVMRICQHVLRLVRPMNL